MPVVALQRWAVRVGQGPGRQAGRYQGVDREASQVAVNEVVGLPPFILEQQFGKFAVAFGAARVQITRRSVPGRSQCDASGLSVSGPQADTVAGPVDLRLESEVLRDLGRVGDDWRIGRSVKGYIMAADCRLKCGHLRHAAFGPAVFRRRARDAHGSYSCDSHC